MFKIYDRNALGSSASSEFAQEALPYFVFGETAAVTDAEDFVEGLLVKGAMSVMYGEPGSGKTFLASDIALHVAIGWQWRDRQVDHGGVVYLALEGEKGIRNRIAAFKEKHALDAFDAPFAVVTTSVNLLDPDADTSAVIATIAAVAARFAKPVDLVVIDTLFRALCGGNENSPEDMGAAVMNGDRIRKETGAHVMWVHHSGKDQAKGARGHSSLKGATDTEIEVTQEDGGQRTARVTKQKELECAGEFTFGLEVIELGTNRRGKSVTSCVVDHGGDPATAPGGVRIGRALKGSTGRALEVLVDLLAEGGQSGHGGTPSGCPSVPEKWWRDRFYERAMPGAEQGAKQRAFLRAAESLIARHSVGMGGGRVWVPAIKQP